MNANELKIRCSALGNVLHFDSATKITLKQGIELKDLLSRSNGLTVKQGETRDKLISKRDAPPALSKGAKTYVKDVYFGKLFDFKKTFTNKFTQKGNKKEASSISEFIKMLGLPMAFKNEKYFENSHTHGTPDSIFKALNFQADAKNVYYPSGLDSFDTKLDHVYEWQGHGYNWLTEVDHGFVIKMLLNPPENLIIKEAKTFWVDAGNEWSSPMPESFVNDVRDYFDFEGKRPIEDRINIHKITTTPKEIIQIKDAVELAREYWLELDSLWKSNNVSEIEFINELKLAV